MAASRLTQAAATTLVLATLCFAFVHALPGDTALRVAAARVGEDRLTTEAADRIRREEGLDRPLFLQYAAWIGQVARFDLGRSMVSRKPVLEELGHYGRLTLQLGALGWLLSYVIALPLGIVAGLRPGDWVDRVTMAVAVALASLPSFLIGVGLIAVFALALRWLPPAGARDWSHMVLPAFTLALGLATYSVRILRNAVAEVRAAFFMTFSRIRGLGAGQAFRRHGVRNALIPVATFAALQLAYVVDGFVVVETLFAYPGLGDLLIKALLARDVPIVMGAALLMGLAYALLNLCADLLCLWLDPRRWAAA
ncbi:MAG: ABC transporter permease [Gemmatimonadaceae bacterium]|nr:ABC transporter permease [Acetobacteraceae bacterium]